MAVSVFWPYPHFPSPNQVSAEQSIGHNCENQVLKLLLPHITDTQTSLRTTRENSIALQGKSSIIDKVNMLLRQNLEPGSAILNVKNYNQKTMHLRPHQSAKCFSGKSLPHLFNNH